MGVHVHCMYWQQFENERVEPSKRADLILTQTTYRKPNSFVRRTRACSAALLYDKEIHGFVSHCKGILVPGGYDVLFTNFEQFVGWYHAST